MDTKINWGKLIEQGRVKAFGVAWNQKERDARYVHMIPAEYVRDGVLTLEDYKKAQTKVEDVEKETGEKPLDHLSLGELLSKAETLNLQVTKDATRDTLVSLISKKLSERKVAKKD